MGNSKKKRVRIESLRFQRKAVRASAAVTKKKNTIHFMTEVDVTEVLKRMAKLKKEGRRISMTTYVAKAFASAVEKYRWMNSFITRGKQVFLDDIAISILVEREIEGSSIDGASVPEPMVVHDVDKKTPWEIADEIKTAKEKSKRGKSMGDLNNAWYFRFIPGCFLKTFVMIGDKSIRMGMKYGKLSITSIGMFAARPIWVIPHGSATILLSVGTTSEKDGVEKLHLTISFDHDIVDGAPAVRFIEDLCGEIEAAECLQ